jgi:hypothetical protein
MNAARDERPIDPPPDDDTADRDWAAALDVIVDLQSTVDATSHELKSARADLAAMKASNWRYVAEKAERDAPQWLVIKRAADKAGCTYEKARAWAAQAIKAGRSNEARKDGGQVSVNTTALIAHLRR